MPHKRCTPKKLNDCMASWSEAASCCSKRRLSCVFHPVTGWRGPWQSVATKVITRHVAESR